MSSIFQIAAAVAAVVSALLAAMREVREWRLRHRKKKRLRK